MPEADSRVESVNGRTVAYGFGASREEALQDARVAYHKVLEQTAPQLYSGM